MGNNNLKASILTPSYNSLKYLKRTLSALEKQDTGKDNFEVIVVDDGSNDGTAEYIKSFNGNLNLIPVINPQNTGRACSRNAGIAHSKNELVIFLDSDIEVKKDFVRLHIKQQDRGECACVGKVIYHPELKKNKFMSYLDTRGAAKIPSGGNIPGKYFRTTNASVPRKVLLEIGCFDEHFRYYGGEDSEIGLRIADKIPIISLPEAIGFNVHVRNLNDTIKIIHEYGKYSLPYLLQKRPEMGNDIKIYNDYREIFLKIICSFPFYLTAKTMADIIPVPYFVYSYLLMRSYRKGFFEAKF